MSTTIVISHYIDAVEIDQVKDQKTKRWRIVIRQTNIELGLVKWYAIWRKYCYFPFEHTIYDASCMESIAKFCANRTIDHKNS